MVLCFFAQYMTFFFTMHQIERLPTMMHYSVDFIRQKTASNQVAQNPHHSLYSPLSAIMEKRRATNNGCI